MAGIGHVAVGVAAGRLFVSSGSLRLWDGAQQREATRSDGWGALALCMVLGVGFSMLPDADIVAFKFGIPYHAPWGHRGASHSLFLACGLGLFVGLGARLMPGTRSMAWRIGLFVALVTASHGLLDTLTDGGLGAALLWPFSNERFFAPWRPIPVSPIGLRSVFSRWGMAVIRTEFVYFLPFFLYAFWPRRAPKQNADLLR